MVETEATKFTNYRDGVTIEYRTLGRSTLGYVDANVDGTHTVYVYDYTTDRGRTYEGRTSAKAFEIMSKHLERMGHSAPAEIVEL